MKKINRKFLMLAERVARNEVEKNLDEKTFTPICTGILHQPKRPK